MTISRVLVRSFRIIARGRRSLLAGCAGLLLGLPASLRGYPEFREFVVRNSGKPVNCALCHQHSDGPEGSAPGQIGSLAPGQLLRLQQARSAFDPGREVDNPILNAFGNRIIQRIGKRKFIELRLRPAELAGLLDPAGDLDRDGIPDVREFLEGTLPVNPNDGNPWLLFLHNARQNFATLCLTLLATAAGMYGLSHLLRAFGLAAREPAQRIAHGEHRA